jgi:hypothetical protein
MEWKGPVFAGMALSGGAEEGEAGDPLTPRLRRGGRVTIDDWVGDFFRSGRGPAFAPQARNYGVARARLRPAGAELRRGEGPPSLKLRRGGGCWPAKP